MEEVTVTATVQVLFPAIVIFENEIGSLAVDGEGEAPQPLYVMVVFAKDTFVGRSSVKLTFETELEPGFVIVNVSVDVPPARIVFGENDLAMLALMILAYRVETP